MPMAPEMDTRNPEIKWTNMVFEMNSSIEEEGCVETYAILHVQLIQIESSAMIHIRSMARSIGIVYGRVW